MSSLENVFEKNATNSSEDGLAPHTDKLQQLGTNGTVVRPSLFRFGNEGAPFSNQQHVENNISDVLDVSSSTMDNGRILGGDTTIDHHSNSTDKPLFSFQKPTFQEENPSLSSVTTSTTNSAASSDDGISYKPQTFGNNTFPLPNNHTNGHLTGLNNPPSLVSTVPINNNSTYIPPSLVSSFSNSNISQKQITSLADNLDLLENGSLAQSLFGMQEPSKKSLHNETRNYSASPYAPMGVAFNPTLFSNENLTNPSTFLSHNPTTYVTTTTVSVSSHQVSTLPNFPTLSINQFDRPTNPANSRDEIISMITLSSTSNKPLIQNAAQTPRTSRKTVFCMVLLFLGCFYPPLWMLLVALTLCNCKQERHPLRNYRVYGFIAIGLLVAVSVLVAAIIVIFSVISRKN